MSVIGVYLEAMQFNRTRTLASLTEIANLANPAVSLGFRPGPGRAPLAWQFMHIGITEDLFATERLFGRPNSYPELAPRFKGGSIPDDETPSVELIQSVLSESRSRLLVALQTFTDADLSVIPEAFKERGWDLRRILQVLNWHESHHQGQAHLSLNLWKAQG